MVVLKFKAWHKPMQRMSEVLAISFERQKVKIRHLRGTTHMTVPLDDVELMQSTGLFDKNGKEIFEGDIVKVTDGDERTDFSDGGIGTICGLDELYMWYIDGQVQNGLFDINQEYYIDVIGNIYQNPELLEGRNV